ncbi:ABC transporter [Corynebacterium phocae]|uniref:ABC transporter n=1 Tax=Corynebacterium phocae TaxID=161895 RepID=A0A1L7D593_9CORY|nr:glutamate ABC transporter substrate-binding protein [Corynebacterium phocae]APT93314.1 ABC transporter [Corynebacterium phocae]KAA8721645.1 glutamate ABC transporter substrate-binding protein [Corynebacterium phocae]
MSTRHGLLSLLLATVLGAGGCAQLPPDTGSPLASQLNTPAPKPARGVPEPYGSVLEPAGSHRAQEMTIAPEKLRGSLRPDDKAPAERVPRILARGRLIVGVDQSNNLMSYRDTVTGDLRGFEVDIAREIARDIFGDPGKVDFRFVTSAGRVPALQRGDVDIIIRSMTVTAKRQEQLEFSLPYMVAHTRMLVETRSGIRSLDNMAGRTACATRGSTSVEWVRDRAPEADILITNNWGDCLMALQLGQVDAIVTDDALLSGMKAQDPYTAIVGEKLSTELYAVGVASGNNGLVRQVNSTLQRIRSDGTWDDIFDEWLGQYLPRPTLPPENFRDEPKGQAHG